MLSDGGSLFLEVQLGEDVHGHEFLQQLLGRVGDLHLVDLVFLFSLSYGILTLPWLFCRQ